MLPGERPALHPSQLDSSAPGWLLIFQPSWAAPGVTGNSPFPNWQPPTFPSGSGQVGESSTGAVDHREAAFLEAFSLRLPDPDPDHWREVTGA